MLSTISVLRRRLLHEEDEISKYNQETHYRGARDEGALDALVQARLRLLGVDALVVSLGRPAVDDRLRWLDEMMLGPTLLGNLLGFVQRQTAARRRRLLVRGRGRRAARRQRATLMRRALVRGRRVHRSVTCGEEREETVERERERRRRRERGE